MILGVITTVLATSVLGIELNYKQLEELGVACPSFDSCAASREIEIDSVSNYRCECKSSCVKYDTCCIDSPNISVLASKSSDVKGNCEKVINSDVWTNVVSNCEDGWTGDDYFKDKCEHPILNFRDPVSFRPVTSLKSEITYKNYFCAICNDDAQFSRTWSIISEDEDDEFIWDEDYESNFADDENSEARTDSDTKKSAKTELDKRYTVYLPPSLIGVVHWCIPDLVSNCHESWTDDEVRDMCKAYMAVQQITPEDGSTPLSYRNVHCAICNFQNYTHDNCVSSRTKRQLPFMQSFNPFIDIAKNYTTIENVPSCAQGEVYDPFYKKCRNLICRLPGFEKVDGKCVRKSNTNTTVQTDHAKSHTATDNVSSCAQGEMYDPFFKKCRKLMCPLPRLFEMIDGRCVQKSNSNTR